MWAEWSPKTLRDSVRLARSGQNVLAPLVAYKLIAAHMAHGRSSGRLSLGCGSGGRAHLVPRWERSVRDSMNGSITHACVELRLACRLGEGCSVMIEYVPVGRDRYRCRLERPDGRQLLVEGEATNGTATVTGDDASAASPALETALLAYALHEHQYRRLRAVEKRDSHREQADQHHRDALALADLVDRPGQERKRGWCSACLTRTSHRRLDGVNRPTPVYLCDNCGAPTTPCRVPGCTAFAGRGLRKVSGKLPFCAAHRHEIPSFAKLGQPLERFEDIEVWLKPEQKNAAKVAKVAGTVTVSAAMLTPVAFALAPAIGGAAGALTGLSGAAATSHGLALFGGGALAAGGLGMAGGTAVITAVGGGLGGALGGSITAAYTRQDDSFAIVKLRDGAGSPVLFATGFMTEGSTDWAGWQRLIDTRYPEAPVYRVCWGAKELKSLALFAGTGLVTNSAKNSVRLWATKASKAAAAKIGPLGGMLTAVGLAKNPWTVARYRADMTGAALADIIARTQQSPVVLMGHSLGGRVMVTAASTLGTRRTSEPKLLESVHVFGAAVSRGGDWRPLNDAVDERVWNYYSRNDQILGRAYRAGEFGKPAVGREGFRSSFASIVDRNVSRAVDGHNAYVKNVVLASR